MCYRRTLFTSYQLYNNESLQRSPSPLGEAGFSGWNVSTLELMGYEACSITQINDQSVFLIGNVGDFVRVFRSTWIALEGFLNVTWDISSLVGCMARV